MTRNLKALGLALVAVFAMSAFIASAAQASPVVTIEDEATLTTESIGVQEFIVNPGAENESELKCNKLTGDATVNNGDPSITLGEIVYEEDCTAKVGSQTLPVIVDMNDCHYTLGGGKEEGTHHFVEGELDITGCTGTGPTITIRNEGNTATVCTYTVWATDKHGSDHSYKHNKRERSGRHRCGRRRSDSRHDEVTGPALPTGGEQPRLLLRRNHSKGG